MAVTIGKIVVELCGVTRHWYPYIAAKLIGIIVMKSAWSSCCMNRICDVHRLASYPCQCVALKRSWVYRCRFGSSSLSLSMRMPLILTQHPIPFLTHPALSSTAATPTPSAIAAAQATPTSATPPSSSSLLNSVVFNLSGKLLLLPREQPNHHHSKRRDLAEREVCV